MPVDRRRRPLNPVHRVRVAENGKSLRARRFAGVVHFVSFKVLLLRQRKQRRVLVLLILRCPIRRCAAPVSIAKRDIDACYDRGITFSSEIVSE